MSDCEPVCSRCKVTSSLMWQRDKGGAILCLDCHTAAKNAKSSPAPSSSSSSTEKCSETSHIGKQQKSTAKSVQVHTASPQPDLPTLGMTTRRTTRSHERARARQLQQQPVTSATPIPHATSIPPTSPSNGTTSTDKPVLKEDTSTLDVTKGASIPDVTKGATSSRDKAETPPLSSSSHGTISNSKSRRSLNQGRPILAPHSQQYMVTANSIEHKVGERIIL